MKPDLVQLAASRLDGLVNRTPLLQSPALNQHLSCNVWFKTECLQIGGSFKIRGALNKLLSLGVSRPRVVAYSSGNHGVATAIAAARLNVSATVVMPSDAPTIKADMVRAAGGSIVVYNRRTEDRVAICHAIAQRTGAQILPSFDDEEIIAGQATAIMELIQDGRSRNIEFDDILIPCGGGGLAAGAALAAEALSCNARLFPVEPKNFDDMARSLRSGKVESNLAATGSICDSLLVGAPGEITYPLIKRRATNGLVATDEQVGLAMDFAFRHLKLVVEPGGAIGLAALLAGAIECRGRSIGVLLSGGNVDGKTFTEIIGGKYTQDVCLSQDSSATTLALGRRSPLAHNEPTPVFLRADPSSPPHDPRSDFAKDAAVGDPRLFDPS